MMSDDVTRRQEAVSGETSVDVEPVKELGRFNRLGCLIGMYVRASVNRTAASGAPSPRCVPLTKTTRRKGSVFQQR